MTASTAQTVSKSTMLVAEPQLFVADKTPCDFYSRKLGFQVARIYGDPPFYAQFARDGVRLNRGVSMVPFLMGGTR